MDKIRLAVKFILKEFKWFVTKPKPNQTLRKNYWKILSSYIIILFTIIFGTFVFIVFYALPEVEPNSSSVLNSEPKSQLTVHEMKGDTVLPIQPPKTTTSAPPKADPPSQISDLPTIGNFGRAKNLKDFQSSKDLNPKANEYSKPSSNNFLLDDKLRLWMYFSGDASRDPRTGELLHITDSFEFRSDEVIIVVTGALACLSLTEAYLFMGYDNESILGKRCTGGVGGVKSSTVSVDTNLMYQMRITPFGDWEVELYEKR